MAGRGFLKSRLAQENSTNIGEPVTPSVLEKQPNSVESSKSPDVHVPIVNVPTMIAGQQQVVRGRRALFAHLQNPNLGYNESRENIASKFSNLELRNLEDIKVQSPEATPVCTIPTIPMIPKSLVPSTQLQEAVSIETQKEEEKPPVVCRVLKKSDKDQFQMCQLSSNYIKIMLEENKGIYEYRVDFDPPVDVKSARFFLVNQHRELFPVKTFDGTLLYVPTKLPDNVTKIVGKLSDQSVVTITISFKRRNSLRECIHFYNVFLRSIMKNLGLVEFGRSCYDQNKRVLIPQFSLEVWPGYVTTIDEYENGLYMCCEVSHRVLRVQTVLEIMTEIGEKTKTNGTDTTQEIMATLCGSTIITHYNHKTYKIDDVDFSLSPLSTFNQNGNEISYLDYYQKMYNIEIKNHHQPLLISKLKKKDVHIKNAPKDYGICCLVPELCNLTGLTESMKGDFKLMKALQNHTLVSPEMRQKAIIDFVNRINGDEKASKKFKDWGVMMRPNPVVLEGPVYKRESILLGNGFRKQIGPNMDWGIDVAKNAMFAAVNVNNWAILYSQRDEPTAKAFCKTLAMCGRPLGMDINAPKPISVKGSNPEVFVSTIHKTIETYSGLQLVVIIFPNQREDRYNAVKRICCADIGIPSQVIVSRTLSKPEKLQSITQKIALQINCKLGGACWSIDIPLKLTMLVGIDTYHEKNKLSNSVVGFVASMDKTFTEWYSVASVQKSTHQELMLFIQEAFHKSVIQFRNKNGCLPEKIIIYRDGVSDGDLKYVQDVELATLQESFKTYPESYNPMVTCIIVQKRINTRVFQIIGNKYSNASPGTVIDNTVTRRNFFDFFLVPQHVRQGTVNPTHYIVIQNGCNLKPENIQRLSYKLCHMYYNWTGTIKVPAPVQYAHKLAYLIGQNVRQMPNEKLNNTLFFL